VALTTSMAESRPKATNATEPARRVSQVQGPVVAVARTARTVVRLQRGPAARSGSGVVGRRGVRSRLTPVKVVTPGPCARRFVWPRPGFRYRRDGLRSSPRSESPSGPPVKCIGDIGKSLGQGG